MFKEQDNREFGASSSIFRSTPYADYHPSTKIKMEKALEIKVEATTSEVDRENGGTWPLGGHSSQLAITYNTQPQAQQQQPHVTPNPHQIGQEPFDQHQPTHSRNSRRPNQGEHFNLNAINVAGAGAGPLNLNPPRIAVPTDLALVWAYKTRTITGGRRPHVEKLCYPESNTYLRFRRAEGQIQLVLRNRDGGYTILENVFTRGRDRLNDIGEVPFTNTHITYILISPDMYSFGFASKADQREATGLFMAARFPQ